MSFGSVVVVCVFAFVEVAAVVTGAGVAGGPGRVVGVLVVCLERSKGEVSGVPGVPGGAGVCRGFMSRLISLVGRYGMDTNKSAEGVLVVPSGGSVG